MFCYFNLNAKTTIHAKRDSNKKLWDRGVFPIAFLCSLNEGGN